MMWPDPWKEVERDVGDMFWPALPRLPKWDLSEGDQGRGEIRFNIYETDKTFELDASVPGVQKDDIKVNLKDGKSSYCVH